MFAWANPDSANTSRAADNKVALVAWARPPARVSDDDEDGTRSLCHAVAAARCPRLGTSSGVP
jgi:hypothetical protein